MESSNNQTTICDDCMVCLCPMNVPTDTITTNCGHIFHTECISIWYDKQSNKFNCPACRESLISTPKIRYDTPDSNNTLCTYFNGATLEGVNEKGDFIGHCKYTNEDGGSMEGERKNGYFIGQCKQTNADGTVMEGERMNGDFIGRCKFTFVGGVFLEGERNNGYFIGQCKQTKQTDIYREVYEGERKNGDFIGLCKYTYINERQNIKRVLECEETNGVFKYKHKFHIGTPVFQYDKKSRLIKRFNSIKSCAKSLKTGRHQITDRLKGVKCLNTASYIVNDYLNQYVFSVTKL